MSDDFSLVVVLVGKPSYKTFAKHVYRFGAPYKIQFLQAGQLGQNGFDWFTAIFHHMRNLERHVLEFRCPREKVVLVVFVNLVMLFC